MRRGRTGVIAAALTAASLAGCGGGGDTSPPPRPAETIDPPAKLPAHWQTEVNPVAGFSIGVPPAWTSVQSDSSTLLRSPDHVVAISASADRTDEALATPLERYAAGAAENLNGFRGLRLLGTRPYDAQYPAAVARAAGTLTSTGVKQRLSLYVLRREAVAAYPVLATRNAGVRSPFAHQIDPIVHSLRGRPVEGAG
jgi:hypothetical protein